MGCSNKRQVECERPYRAAWGRGTRGSETSQNVFLAEALRVFFEARASALGVEGDPVDAISIGSMGRIAAIRMIRAAAERQRGGIGLLWVVGDAVWVQEWPIESH